MMVRSKAKLLEQTLDQLHNLLRGSYRERKTGEYRLALRRFAECILETAGCNQYEIADGINRTRLDCIRLYGKDLGIED